MHFGDSIIIFIIALIMFGPKKLPEMARQLAKLMAEFRRASNEFKSQIDEELRSAEQADRQKQISAAAAANPEPQPEPAILPPSTGVPVSQYGYNDPAESERPDRSSGLWPEPPPLLEGGLSEAALPEPLEADLPAPMEQEPVQGERPFGHLFADTAPSFGAPYPPDVSSGGASQEAAVGLDSDPGPDGAPLLEGSAAENAEATIHHG